MSNAGSSISHYAILERIGEGGMGVVYKAQDTKLKRTVALKFLKEGAFGSAEQRARFLREAQAAAILDHPHICPVYEIDERDGQAFIAMAYCAGRSLRERLKEGPLPVREALDIAVQVAEGLEEAHARGVVHRDIKGANIMITDKGQVKIMDFGIAKLSGGTDATWSGEISGTAAYMSPEQAMGGPVDGRTDLWSLGVVLYEMLAGELPFKGGTDAGVVHSVIYEHPAPLREARPDCPAAVAAIVGKLLRKKPGERYGSAKDLLGDLRAAGGRPVEVAASAGGESRTFAKRRDPKARRRQRLMAIAGAAALAVAAELAVPGLRRGVAALIGYRPVPSEKHLLVLPFANVGGESTGRALCDGFLEVLTSELTRLERFQKAFWVAPASEVRRSGIASAGEARRAFGANLVISGSLQRVGGDVTLTLNLVDASSLRQVRSEVVNGTMSGFASFQGALVEGAVRMLDLELAPSVRRGLAERGTASSEAYECYVKGRGRLERYERPESLAEAVDLFNRAVLVDPAYASAYLGLAEALWRRSESSSDRALIELALEACRRAEGLGAAPGPLRAQLGAIALVRGRVQEAIGEFEAALGADPSDAQALLGLADAWERTGRADKAEETYKRAIALKPTRWSGYSYLGVFYWNAGRLPEAEGMFLKVLELTPDNVRAMNNLIGVYWSMKREDLARRMFDRSIKVKPNAEAYSNLGVLEFYEGRYAEAARLFELSVRTDPEDATMWGNLGDAYRYVPGNADKALHAYAQAARLATREKEIDPQDASLRVRLAFYLACVGRSEEAQAEVGEALRLAPASARVLKKSVLVYERLGLRGEALATARAFIAAGGAAEDLGSDPDLAGLAADPGFKELSVKPR